MTTPTILTRFRALGALFLLGWSACGYDYVAPSPPPPPPPPPSPLLDGLWTGSGRPSAILRLAPEQLNGAGEPAPATRILTPSGELLTRVSVAFDGDGTMWTTSREDSLLFAFSPAVLTRSGSPGARTVMTSVAGSLSLPSALAFDRRHRLWVANLGNGTLVRFDSAQLVAGGALVPAVTLTGVGQPTGLAFDAAGALWVSDVGGESISKFPPSELVVSGAPRASVVFQGPASGLDLPVGLAFDAAGNLWVANPGNLTVVGFSAAQLAVGTPRAPKVVLGEAPGVLISPHGLAFDALGNLWVVNGVGILVGFRRADLAASGAPEPLARLGFPGHSFFGGVAFWPRPSGLPLN